MKLFIVMSLMIPVLSVAKTYLPNGCGTYITCKETKNAKGELNGEQICTNASKSNIIVIKAHWVNDKLDKEFFCANDDGIPKVQANYKMGELNGLYKEYDSSLKIWALEQNYKNGKREGLSKRTIADGKQIIKFFKDDKQYGYEIVVDKNGKLLSKNRCEINNTRKDNSECDKISIPGYEKLLSDQDQAEKTKKEAEGNRTIEDKYPDGKTKRRLTMVNGKVEGKEEHFDKNGNPVSMFLHKNGIRQESTFYFEEGQIKSKSWYKNNGMWNYKKIEYYQNGKTKSEFEETALDDQRTERKFKEYYDNGNLSSEGKRHTFMKDYYGQLDGAHKEYNKDGSLFVEEFFAKGELEGERKVFREKYDILQNYKKGKLVTETLFKKGTTEVLRKKEFMPDGSVKSETVAPGFKE